MEMKIVIVGAGGYLGRQVLRFSRKYLEGAEIVGYDLGIYGVGQAKAHDIVIKDIADVRRKDVEGAVVVYLPSFHTAPEGAEHDPHWVAAYQGLMSDVPARMLAEMEPKGLLYVSSMRALTCAGNLYGRTKRHAERRLFCYPTSGIVRFGTLWGPWFPDAPNRPSTAVHAAMRQGDFYGDTWSGFTTYLPSAISEVLTGVLLLAMGQGGWVRNVTDTPVELSADSLRELAAGVSGLRIQERYSAVASRYKCTDLREDLRARGNLQVYYGLHPLRTP